LYNLSKDKGIRGRGDKEIFDFGFLKKRGRDEKGALRLCVFARKISEKGDSVLLAGYLILETGKRRKRERFPKKNN